jgi:hypothetical protein
MQSVFLYLVFILVMAAKAAAAFSFGSWWVEDFDGAEVSHIVVKKELTTIPAMRNLQHHHEAPTVNLHAH